MTSKALASCIGSASPTALPHVVSYKSPSKVEVGLGPSHVSFAVFTRLPSLRSGNLVLRAQQSDGDIIDGGHRVDVQIHKNTPANPNQFSAVDHRPQRLPADAFPFGLVDSFSQMRSMRQMLDTMDRLLEETMAMSNRNEEELRPRIPWEVIDDNSELKIRFDMPGISEKDVKISVEDDNVLVIKGEHKKEEGQDNAWAKTSYCSYHTCFQLPDECEVDNKIDAKIKDGVLYITVPKKEIVIRDVPIIK